MYLRKSFNIFPVLLRFHCRRMAVVGFSILTCFPQMRLSSRPSTSPQREDLFLFREHKAARGTETGIRILSCDARNSVAISLSLAGIYRPCDSRSCPANRVRRRAVPYVTSLIYLYHAFMLSEARFTRLQSEGACRRALLC